MEVLSILDLGTFSQEDSKTTIFHLVLRIIFSDDVPNVLLDVQDSDTYFHIILREYNKL